MPNAAMTGAELRPPSRHRWRPVAGAICLALVPTVIALALVAGPARTLADLTRDAAATTGAPPWLGFISMVGVMYWSAASAIALFSSSVAPRDNGDARFLRLFGLLLAVLALDDLFMIHEDIAPSVGIPEDFIMVLYAAAAIALAVGYRDRFQGLDRSLGVSAVGALTLSLAVDTLTHGGDTSSAIEDCLKLVGITTILVLVVRLSRAACERHVPRLAGSAMGRGTATGRTPR